MTDTIVRHLQENVILCMNNTVRIIMLMVSSVYPQLSVLFTCDWSNLFSWFGLIGRERNVM